MKFLKEATNVRYAIAKTTEICQNQHADLLRFLLIVDSLKIKKGLELVSLNFLMKIFVL